MNASAIKGNRTTAINPAKSIGSSIGNRKVLAQTVAQTVRIATVRIHQRSFVLEFGSWWTASLVNGRNECTNSKEQEVEIDYEDISESCALTTDKDRRPIGGSPPLSWHKSCAFCTGN